MIQLELLPPPPPPPSTLWCESPEGESLKAELRAIEKSAVAIAREMGFDCDRTRDLATPDYSLVWAEYHRRHSSIQSVPRAEVSPARRDRGYRPWSLERKQRERVRRLWERLRKRYSIPDLLIPAIQDEVIANPWYYGCCPLPKAGDSFPANVPSPEYLAAIAREQSLAQSGL